MWAEHKRDFDSFTVSFDNYYSTDSDENKQLSEQIYTALKARDLIAEREVEQFYDPVKNMFLPDRFIRANARSAAPRTSTATPARSAAPPMRRPT